MKTMGSSGHSEIERTWAHVCTQQRKRNGKGGQMKQREMMWNKFTTWQPFGTIVSVDVCMPPLKSIAFSFRFRFYFWLCTLWCQEFTIICSCARVRVFHMCGVHYVCMVAERHVLVHLFSYSTNLMPWIVLCTLHARLCSHTHTHTHKDN